MFYLPVKYMSVYFISFAKYMLRRMRSNLLVPIWKKCETIQTKTYVIICEKSFNENEYDRQTTATTTDSWLGTDSYGSNWVTDLLYEEFYKIPTLYICIVLTKMWNHKFSLQQSNTCLVMLSFTRKNIVWNWCSGI